MSFLNGNRVREGILNPPGKLVRFSPPDSEVVYLLRQPQVGERPQIRRAINDRAGRQWFPLDLLRILRGELAGLVAAEPPEDRDPTILQEIDGHIEALEQALRIYHETKAKEDLRAFTDLLLAGTPRLDDMRDAAMELCPAYARKVRANEERPEKMIQATFAFAVHGWEQANLPPCERDAFGVKDELLEHIPTSHMTAVTERFGELLDPSEATLKNLPSASRGPASANSTTSPNTSTPTTTTRSRSPRGISVSSDGPTSESIPSIN